MPTNPTAAQRQGRSPSILYGNPRDLAVVALAVFIAAVVGTLSRPLGFLAVFWPANALLAGLLTRVPQYRNLATVLAAAVGYQAAALVLGDGFWIAVLLTAANLTGAIAFAAMFLALEPVDRALSRPQGVISMVIMAAAASGLAGLVGGLAMPSITQQSYVDSMMGWFASELVNYLALLPVILTLPSPSAWLQRPQPEALRQSALPALAVLVSVMLSLLVKHPVAIAFPVPALIWCALTLPMWATAVLVMFYSGLGMFAMKLGMFELGGALTRNSITVTHLVFALVALVPLVIASVNADRRRQLGEVTT